MRRRLDIELVRRRLVESRTAAAHAIREGQVVVVGAPEPKPATLVDPSTSIRLAAAGPRYVSRGGLKLQAAIGKFRVSVSGRAAIDVGASTGGFTHCLLYHGARSVVAVDVGYGQLHFSLRNDPRVTVVERTNIRYADPARLGAPFQLVVVDVSFISLCTIAPTLVGLGDSDTDYILLIKPQFEAARGSVDRRGVVKDPQVHAKAVADTVGGLARSGLEMVDTIPSPVLGAKGNQEVLGLFRHGQPAMAPGRIETASG